MRASFYPGFTERSPEANAFGSENGTFELTWISTIRSLPEGLTTGGAIVAPRFGLHGCIIGNSTPSETRIYEYIWLIIVILHPVRNEVADVVEQAIKLGSMVG